MFLDIYSYVRSIFNEFSCFLMIFHAFYEKFNFLLFFQLFTLLKFVEKWCFWKRAVFLRIFGTFLSFFMIFQFFWKIYFFGKNRFFWFFLFFLVFLHFFVFFHNFSYFLRKIVFFCIFCKNSVFLWFFSFFCIFCLFLRSLAGFGRSRACFRPSGAVPRRLGGVPGRLGGVPPGPGLLFWPPEGGFGHPGAVLAVRGRFWPSGTLFSIFERFFEGGEDPPQKGVAKIRAKSSTNSKKGVFLATSFCFPGSGGAPPCFGRFGRSGAVLGSFWASWPVPAGPRVGSGRSWPGLAGPGRSPGSVRTAFWRGGAVFRGFWPIWPVFKVFSDFYRFLSLFRLFWAFLSNFAVFDQFFIFFAFFMNFW